MFSGIQKTFGNWRHLWNRLVIQLATKSRVQNTSSIAYACPSSALSWSFRTCLIRLEAATGRSGWLDVDIWWTCFRFWPRLVFPAFLVGTRERKIIVDWRRWEKLVTTVVDGAYAGWLVYSTYPFWKTTKTTKNQFFRATRIFAEWWMTVTSLQNSFITDKIRLTGE